MTEAPLCSRITGLQAIPVWERNPTTGLLVPGLVVTATMSWTEGSSRTMTSRFFGSLTPRGVCERRPRSGA